jgi:hypothetical protein
MSARRRGYQCIACGLRGRKADFPVMVIDYRSPWQKTGNRLYTGREPWRLCGYKCFLKLCERALLEWRQQLTQLAAVIGRAGPVPHRYRLRPWPRRADGRGYAGDRVPDRRRRRPRGAA